MLIGHSGSTRCDVTSSDGVSVKPIAPSMFQGGLSAPSPRVTKPERSEHFPGGSRVPADLMHVEEKHGPRRETPGVVWVEVRKSRFDARGMTRILYCSKEVLRIRPL